MNNYGTKGSSILKKEVNESTIIARFSREMKKENKFLKSEEERRCE